MTSVQKVPSGADPPNRKQRSARTARTERTHARAYTRVRDKLEAGSWKRAGKLEAEKGAGKLNEYKTNNRSRDHDDGTIAKRAFRNTDFSIRIWGAWSIMYDSNSLRARALLIKLDVKHPIFLVDR